MGTIGIYDWSPPVYLSCTTCPAPRFVAVKEGDARKKLIATSTNGCIDSAFTDITVPPADDFTVRIDTVFCSVGDSLRATFTVCNQFGKGIIPKGLKLSFYNNDPALSPVVLLGPVFEVANDNLTTCATYSHVFKDNGALKIFAVVNDKGSVPHALPNDTIAKEKDYTNNKASFNYQPEMVIISPADTTVFPFQPVSLNIVSPVYNAGSVTWFPDQKYTLSCTNCLSPVVQVRR